ncbi:hypothetical protein Tco_0057528, partial [Tanacetum coccineum]
RNQEMSQSLSSNVPDNSPKQEATTGHSIPRRLYSPTSQEAARVFKGAALGYGLPSLSFV